jgi:hypothetical protein
MADGLDVAFGPTIANAHYIPFRMMDKDFDAYDLDEASSEYD